jgi:hypothetical protein
MIAVERVMLSLIELPAHKLEYVLHTKTFVDGLWGCLKAYGIEHTKENHELLVELVQTKLEGPDLEREWSEEEYENFVVFKGELDGTRC